MAMRERKPIGRVEGLRRRKLMLAREKFDARHRGPAPIKVVHTFKIRDREFRIIENPDESLYAEELKYVAGKPGETVGQLFWARWEAR